MAQVNSDVSAWFRWERKQRIAMTYLPHLYETTAEMIAKYIYDVTKKQVPSDLQLKVAVSETPNSWVEYEDD
ncbi:6-pyruvoyl trahydropterin synthase family protein [Halotia branconii]|uniref:6-carboxy-5,6,7,8-tetrahydropterin synthase n=1 Tax=Halotia branconii CENA392 TaxID=1539056 RepID=A0AAJ6NQ96_9CYAN|nr:6-carboxytetrahydropterin synthase [Halotia branconii]WGV24617.1 6-carboxytetrahydropterin synthase [Halotia branconii CENA392]